MSMPAEEALRIACRGHELEARLAPGERGAAVLAPPHPEYGGRLDNPVVEQMRAGLARAGYGTLRFNFRGTGASTGQASASQAAADADYAAALAVLAEHHAGPYLAAGYSFGSAAALRVAGASAGGTTSVERVLMIAPPLPMLTRALFEGFGGPIDIVIGDEDGFSRLAELQSMLADLPNVKLEVIAGADHFFASGLGELARLVAAALEG
jgi:alpha/beta superfamily hydrolase